MRTIARMIMVAAALGWGSTARAAPCMPDSQDLPAVGSGFKAPPGATAISGFLVRDQNGRWTPVDRTDLPVPPPAALDQALRDRLGAAAPAADGLAAVWKVGAGSCEQVIRTPAAPPSAPPGKFGGATPGAAPSASAYASPSGLSEEECPSTGDPLANCQQCAAAWKGRMSKELRGHKYSLAVYTESGDACLIENGTAGEPILFGIYSDLRTEWDPLRVDPCSIEPDAPAVFVSTPGLIAPGGRESDRVSYYLRRYPSRRCYNSVVDLRVTGKRGGTALLVDHPLQQAQRYRATLQLGAVFTRQHLHSFALRPSGSSTVIYDQGPTGTGTEYQASLVLYALPRNLLSLFGGAPYSGRDLLRDQGVLDRLGGLLGVSLSDPSRRFYAGLSFEVIYGVNVTWGVEFFRGRELAGVAVGDPFSATDTIPTRERWDWDKVWGVSIDLLYVKNLYGGKALQ